MKQKLQVWVIHATKIFLVLSSVLVSATTPGLNCEKYHHQSSQLWALTPHQLRDVWGWFLQHWKLGHCVRAAAFSGVNGLWSPLQSWLLSEHVPRVLCMLVSILSSSLQSREVSSYRLLLLHATTHENQCPWACLCAYTAIDNYMYKICVCIYKKNRIQVM